MDVMDARALGAHARVPGIAVCSDLTNEIVWARGGDYSTLWPADTPFYVGSILVMNVKNVKDEEEAALEATIKNIEACKKLSTITRTSLGPNGMNKMVINPLDKRFVTNDAATIVNELEIQHPAAKLLDKLFVTNDAATIVNELGIQHPAAKLLVLAAKSQQEENGDGANLTISFAGELLQKAEELIKLGLHPREIISGYTKAINKAVEILEQLVESSSETMDVRKKDEVISRMRAAVASKQFGQEDKICSLVADACIQVCPNNPTNFNVDNVRVAKLLGGGLHNSYIVHGMVLKSDAVGSLPSPDDLGYVEEIGGVTVTSVRNEEGGNSISTVVLRGSTDSILDDLERAVYDGVNTYKAMCRDSRIVPGAAATEIELAQRLKEYANAERMLDKYVISKYAESFEVVPKTLADNARLNAMEIIAALYTGHVSGNTKLALT